MEVNTETDTKKFNNDFSKNYIDSKLEEYKFQESSFNLENNYTLNNNNLKTSNMFRRIRDSNLLSEILMFLNLSNIRVVMFVCRRFRKHLLKEDEKELRKLGNLTYGIDQYKDFDADPLEDIKLKTIKSNIYPVAILLLVNDLDIIISSPGTIEQGLIIWRQSTGIYEAEIRYKDESGERGFVSVMTICNYENNYYLAVAYIDGDVYVYNLKTLLNQENKRRVTDVIWKKTVGVNERELKKISYVKSRGQLLTCEISCDVNLNVLKFFEISSGVLIKTATLSNVIITSLKLFDFYEDSGHKTHLTMGLSDGKIALKSLNQLEQEANYTEIIPNYYLYGHEGEVTDLLYLETEKKDLLISSSNDLYIFFWDTRKKIATRITDSLHDSEIINLCILDENVFATCSKDRKVMLWSCEDCSHLKTLDTHKSTIYGIDFNPFTRRLYSASYDKNIHCTEISEKLDINKKGVINGHLSAVTSARLDYVSGIFITSSTDKSLKIWDFKEMALKKTIEFRNENFDDFILLHDDFNTLVKVDLTKKIKCINTKTEKVYETFEEKSPARCLLNLYDAVSFLVGLSNSEIAYYNYFQAKDKNIFKRKKTLVHSVGEEITNKNLKIKKLIILDFYKKIVASVGSDGSICIFYLKETIKKFIAPNYEAEEVDCICPVRIDSNSEIIAFSRGESLHLYDLVSMTYCSEIYLGKVNCIDRLSDRYLILSHDIHGKSTDSIQIYDVESNKIISKNETSYKNIRRLYYMKDGQRVVALNGDNESGYAMDVIIFSKEAELESKNENQNQFEKDNIFESVSV
jgi:WD40 repeat protein